MSLPAFHALRERFPKAHISILARPWVAGLYGREPFCDELIPYDAPKGIAGLTKKWALVSRLRRRHFDCAISFQNAFEAAAVMWLARIPVRIGYDRDARGCLLTNPIAVPKRGEIPRHERFYYLELLRRAHLIDSYSHNPVIHLSGSPEARDAGRQRFQDASIVGPVIGVSPGAAYGGAKRWLPERFAEAAVEVARDRGATVAIFGSKEESAACESVRQAVDALGVRCFNFSGRTSLPEFIELAAACDVYLTNDSGPMHITSALGVPTIAIFGATDFETTGPTGSHSRVVQERVECSPCLLRECPIDHRCMTGVSASRVAQEAMSLLAIQKISR